MRISPRLLVGIRKLNAALIIGAALWFLILPVGLVIRDLSDPTLRQPEGIPRAVWRVHQHLTPLYQQWARERIAAGSAATVGLYDVAATEWAMFGSVFYLAATENLQREWLRHPGPPGTAPASYARGAIEAATDLVLDPVHHSWVRTHWGPNYLHRENVFFRAMLIQAMTSRENLVKDGRDSLALRDQVETLAAALDASPHGILNDYPGECYPIDVFATVAMIRRADAILGTDHRAFAERERRAFSGSLVDPYGLPGYFANPDTGTMEDVSRGIGNSYVCLYCPELYPDLARKWYDRYIEGFWQRRLGAAGFREYARTVPGRDFFIDVDSGPVIAGFSPAANAYGVAAARANGRYDHAWTLSSQVLAAAWPLPDGTWLGARMLSSTAHAPYLGEANLLFLFTTLPAAGTTITTGGFIPPLVYIVLAGFLALGGAVVITAIKAFRRANGMPVPRAVGIQVALWLLLLGGGVTLLMVHQTAAGALMVLASQFLPRDRN